MSMSFRSPRSADTAAPTLRSFLSATPRSTSTTTPTHTPAWQACTKRRADVPPGEVDLERLMTESRIRVPIDRLAELGMASPDVPIEVVRGLEARLLRRLPAEGGQ